MSSSIYFTVCCLIFTTILLIEYFSKKRIDTSENGIYSGLSIVTLISLCLEIANYALIVYGFGEKDFLFILCSKLILISFYIWGSLFSMYINVSINKEKTNKLYKYLIPALSFVILLLPISFMKKGSMVIPSGLSVLFLYLVLGFIIVFSIVKMLSYKERDMKKFYPLLLLVLLTVVSIVTQFFNPTILFSDIIFPVILFVMFFTIENPDIKIIRQLEIAREEADKANRSKTEFLSSMSHEIRTPLNAIVGFSDCILEAETIGDAKENAKDIVNASQTLLDIVNSILDISKIEAGKVEIVNTRYDPREVFSEVAKLIAPRMQDKGLEFTYVIDSNLPAALFGDQANIKKIITNFLSNACKYTDKGFVRYEVHCKVIGNYARIIITVEDSGRGIKPEGLDKLFTRFQRLDEDKNTSIEGTGLGLAISKQLTESMGGRVFVRSEYGRGSKFSAVINQKIEQFEPFDDKNARKATLNLHDIKILIVDDAPLNLKVETKLFEKYNANSVDTCLSGEDCLEKIRGGARYDLIFLDDMMPRMSGVETFRKLQEIPGFQTPTIALTANAISGMKEKYISLGFSYYLAKPIEQKELIRICNNLLGRSHITTLDDMPVIHNPGESSTVIPVGNDIEKVVAPYIELHGESSIDTVEVLDDKTVDLIPVVDLDMPTNSSIYDRTYLEKNGVDVEHALELLGDMDMYNMTVHDFLLEVEEKWERIKDYLLHENMEDYAIDVHSLKSDCKYIGLMHLADIAYDHELKSKANDISYVRDHFQELENEYHKALEIMKNYDSQLPQ